MVEAPTDGLTGLAYKRALRLQFELAKDFWLTENYGKRELLSHPFFFFFFFPSTYLQQSVDHRRSIVRPSHCLGRHSHGGQSQSQPLLADRLRSQNGPKKSLFAPELIPR